MSILAPPSTSLNDAQRLVQSREFCRELTRNRARNFYYGLKLLPEPKRSAMYALYAYMRIVDDIADANDGRTSAQRTADLGALRRQTHATLQGEHHEQIHKVRDLWPAFAEMVRRYHIPLSIFDEVIVGQSQDLSAIDFDTFEQLREYCYRVAGVVGLASIRVWGYAGGDETESLAIHRGVAFQLTNILRDLREDASRGRVYLPREELHSVGMDRRDLLDGRTADRFEELMRFQIARAESFYEQSRGLERRIEPDSRPTLVAMTEIYHGLLQKIAAEPGRVMRERVSLSILSKLRIGWRAMRLRGGSDDHRVATSAAGVPDDA